MKPGSLWDFLKTKNLLKGISITIKQIYQNKQVHYGELMESFLESLWYCVYLKIQSAMMLKKQRLQKDTEVSKQHRGDGET